MSLKGSLVAIVTPFRDGVIDEEIFTTLIEEQIEGGTNGIIVAGTTGESPTLSHEEHRRVIELCVKTVNGRISVVAGTGSNATAEAVELTEHAASVGADAALLVNPYYNKPSQEGLYLHYKAVAEAVDIPQIVYNIPGRTAGKVSVDTMARLGELKNIVGVKDAVGDLAETSTLIERLGPEFIVLSGDDALTLPMMAIGGHGVISVLANILPETVSKMVGLAAAGNFAEARKIHTQTRSLGNAMFYETNPVPVKTALALLGKIKEEFRLPLCPMAQINKERLIIEMRKAGLLDVEKVSG